MSAFAECFGCRRRAGLFRRGRCQRNESHGGRAGQRPAARERQSRARLRIAAYCCVLLCIAERTAPADRWPIRIADADAAAQVRRAAEQNEIDRPAIGSKRVAAWGREHDNEKQAAQCKSVSTNSRKTGPSPR
ncbi:hypothetical protein [Burkholderia cepacia]|uniref:hypothetical protein n=1 Tax=Burkholderia cepacia TaxID=292 RepID=UPI001295F0D4